MLDKGGLLGWLRFHVPVGLRKHGLCYVLQVFQRYDTL